MITTTYDMTGFNSGMAGLVKATGATMRVVVAEETGELIKALVQKSPPRNLQKSAAALRKSIGIRFDLTRVKPSRKETISPSGGVQWVYSTDQFLYGIAPDLDMRRASPAAVAQKFLTSRTRKNGQSRWLFAFKNPRRGQRVSITQKVTVLEKTAIAAGKLLVKRFGKLKASWLAAAGSAIKITGGRFPAWVLNHVPTAHGRSINGLSTPGAPFFEVISSAKGVGAPAMGRIIKTAIAYRVASMKTNAKLFTKGIKHLGDYANGQVVRV